MAQTPETILSGMLAAAGLPKKASYTPGEVCDLLSIDERTFRAMAAAYEPGPDGSPRAPATIHTITLRTHRRVPHDELVDFLRRNDTYQRLNALPETAPEPVRKPKKKKKAVPGKVVQLPLFRDAAEG